MADRNWTLKILSGVHVGAEVTLVEEEAVLGSDDDCDLVLEDDRLAGRHISLLAAESGVRLRVLDSGNPVLVDGQQIGGSALLEAFQVVSIGGLSLAVGPAGQAWPHIDLPPVEAGDGDAPELDKAAAPTGSTAYREGSEAGTEGVRVEGADTAAERSPRRMQAAAVAVAALLVVAGASWLLAPKAPHREHAEPAQAAREVEKIASRYGAVVQVNAPEIPDAPVAVTGNIGTERDLRGFLEELAETDVRATVHLVSSEQLVNYVNAILEQSLNRDGRNRVEAQPVTDAPGELVISGYVERPASLAATRELLARDLSGSRGLSYRIETRADRLAVLQQRLEGLGLADRLRIQQLADSVGLFGPVRSAGELARIRKLAEEFNAEFDSRPPLRLDGTDSFLGISTIDFDVRAVVLGERIHVIAQDGASYAEGSKIPGGYVVRTITERYMILEKPAKIRQVEEDGEPALAYVIFDGV